MAKRDVAYDYIRVFAMLAIILCHFFQVRNSYILFSWLNIGVQLFFVLSAKLLSQIEVTSRMEIVTFYKTRWLRICLPLWIYLLCLVPVLFVVGRGPKLSAIAMYTIGMSGFAPSGILGLGHLWYVTVLLLLYLLVPVLNCVDRACAEMKLVKGVLIKTIFVIAPILVFATTPVAYFGVNMALFIVAYFYFRTIGDCPQWDRKLALWLLPLAVGAIGVRLCLESLSEPNVQLYELGTTAAKAVLGMFLFATLHWLFSAISCARPARGIALLSKVSYEVYIVHQFILLALYEFVPIFRREDILSGLALLVVALMLIFINTAVLYTVKIKIEKTLRQYIAC